jgi:hypothetical protein
VDHSLRRDDIHLAIENELKPENTATIKPAAEYAANIWNLQPCPASERTQEKSRFQPQQPAAVFQ